MSSDLKPSGAAASAVKMILHKLSKAMGQPCCVCKDEKASRDECMLFSNAADPQEACQGTVEKYRSCMRGFGFHIA